MKNILFALDPEEEERDFGESFEGFISNLADRQVKDDFKRWAKQVAQEFKKADSLNVITGIAEDIDDFSDQKAIAYLRAGFAVGMAYADLVPKRNEETENILNPIKCKLKKSGFLPGERKEGRIP